MDKRLLIIPSLCCALPVFMLAPGRAKKQQKAQFYGRNIAHRGLHTKDRSVAENSPEAFRRAVKAGYGAELDVHLTRDGQVVVFHDDTLDRVCGVSGRIDDMLYDELRQYRLAGTDEHIPLFTEVLDIIDGKAPLVVELKTCRRRRELCRKTYRILSTYPGQVCVESFDPLIIGWFRLHGRELLRGQLAAQASEYTKQTKKVTGFLLSHCLLNFISRPQFIAYRIGRRPLTVHLSEALGAMRFGWTSHSPENEKGRDAVIFEFYRPALRFK